VASEAYDVSGTQIVGWGAGPATSTAKHALLWTGETAGSAVNLNPAGFVFSRALGVDAQGGQQVRIGGSKRISGPDKISGPDNVPHHHGREAGAPSATATGAAGEGEEREQGRTVAGCPGRTPAKGLRPAKPHENRTAL
jgi:hypothetical protein